MLTNLSEYRDIEIYIDEQANVAIYPQAKNPNYEEHDLDDILHKRMDASTVPMHIPAKEPIELKMPYRIEDVANAIEEAFGLWEKCEPLSLRTKTIEEHYYKIKGFKRASFGKKMISAGWDDYRGKYVDLSVPSKTGTYYWTLKKITLAKEADWTDFANAVLELIHTDITQLSAYKTYKSKLNI